MTPQDVADELGISRQRVYVYLRNGRLRATNLSGTWVITREQFEEFRKCYTDRPGRPPKDA